MDNIISNTINDLSNQFITASQTYPPRDPLIIDLNYDGVHIINVENGVYFDIDNNGFAERTEWIDTIDGFLVYNRDEDPRITNGTELFSDQVILPNGKKSTDGFEVLKTFDTNNDNVLDRSDSNFAELGVWIDKDHNGQTLLPAENEILDENHKELYTLEELGITSIGTDFIIIENEDGSKTFEAEVKLNGKNTTISEQWFDSVTSDTLELNTECIDDDLTSFGNLHSVSYALENDTDGILQDLMDSFKSSQNYVERRVLVKKILYHISGADKIDSKSRGGYIDAREIHVLEAIMGVDTFLGIGNSKNPNTNAAAILRRMYTEFEELYFNLLNKEGPVSNALDLIIEICDDNGNAILDMNLLNSALENMKIFNELNEDVICSICSYLKTYDNAYKTNYFNQFVTAHPNAVEVINRYNKAIIFCNESNNTFNGTSADEIFWAENDNITINASSGNDIIYGGDGNDKLNAGDGNDVVYGGNGNDTVNAGSGNDIIYGGKGNDNLNGDGGNDTIYGENGNDTINGDAGDDILYGGKGNDVINGGANDDIIYGGEGDDSISGGTGDDVLYGDIGDDIYYINAEHGNDVIHDSMGLSTLVFGNKLSADDYSLSIDINNGMILVHNETGEKIGLSDFINNPMNYDFIFDGESKILGGGDSRQVIEGTDENDVITGGNGFNIIYGNDRNDIITGGDNLNFIYGGDGDDTINGGNGTNIIRGENGDDVICDGSGDGYLDGGDGNDTIYGGDGNDVIIGGAGADELHGENGDDVIVGNDGDDVLYGEDGNDTLYADAGNDELNGGNGNDSLFGDDGDDTLYGDAGDDYLEAGNGIDTLYGGTGNDTFVGGEGINYMYGEDGDDTFYGGNALNYMYGGNGDDNFTGGELADYIEGGAGNDTMNGGNGNNEMYGGDGDDYIYGGNDDDYIEGGNGDDHLYGGNGVNTIYGGAGNDIIYSGDNGSFLYGGDGDDQIFAGAGADVLDGGAGNDYLQGDHGGDTYIFGIGYDIDTINASADLNTVVIHGYTSADMYNTRMANNDLVIDFGEDTGDRLIMTSFFNYNSNRDFNFVFDDGTVLGQYDIKAASAPIVGTDGDEWLSVQGNDGGIIHAGAGNDGLSGGSGNDELYGEDGDDTLYGNDGNDLLDGCVGNDQLNGGNGTDTYIFAKGYGNDTINEWGNDHSIVKLTDINSDDVTVTDQWGSNLIITINSTGDTLTISNFKWGQSTYSFEFADGAIASVNKDTWELEFSVLPEISEDDAIQANAEILDEIYADDSVTSEFFTDTDSTVITDVTESTVFDGDNADISDMTDIQAMLLAENMSVFGNDDQVYDSMNITDMTADTSLTDSLLVGSLQ